VLYTKAERDLYFSPVLYCVCLYVSQEEVLPVEHELVMVVRKELAIALRDLLQHGLMEVLRFCLCHICEDAYSWRFKGYTGRQQKRLSVLLVCTTE